MIVIIFVLLLLLIVSAAANLWLMGLLEETQRDQELGWADPEAIRDLEVPHE